MDFSKNLIGAEKTYLWTELLYYSQATSKILIG